MNWNCILGPKTVGNGEMKGRIRDILEIAYLEFKINREGCLIKQMLAENPYLALSPAFSAAVTLTLQVTSLLYFDTPYPYPYLVTVLYCTSELASLDQQEGRLL
jgi:hypothetical protein